MIEEKDRLPNAGAEGWDHCAPGVLTGYSRRVQRRHFLFLTAKTTGIAGCVAGLGAIGWLEYLRRLEADYQLSGLTCSDVNELMPAYLSERLNAARSKLLEEHVRRCSSCASLRSKLRHPTV